MHRPTRWIAVALSVFALAACADTPNPVESNDDAAHFRHNAQGDAEFGTTGGWADGATVEFFYNKAFFCRQPPASAAASGCEVGEMATRAPRPGKIPVLYVMTPLGFRPDESTLQCPTVGSCINHPSTLDLSRVFGPAASEVALPAHSHIIDETLPESHMNGGNAGWWLLEVVGVTDPAVWDAIVASPSLATVRALQAEGRGITGDIPTNAYLFFGVRPQH